MSWRLDEYRDKVTNRVTHLEITPDADLKPHLSSEKCECLPSLSMEKGVKRLIHNAFDGREVQEKFKEAGH